jgi:hypothetical protein
MITVCGRKCLKNEHFGPQTVIMNHPQFLGGNSIPGKEGNVTLLPQAGHGGKVGRP